MEKTFSILTFGCKLNQFDSECIRQSLIRRNWILRRFEEGARFCIINSCTVTSKSDARCRNAVRRMRKISPGSFIVVTGCYAETQREAVSALTEIDLVLGATAKQAIPGILDGIAAGDGSGISIARTTAADPPSENAEINGFLDHSRAFVKIQEGCSASCSYCIVPRARGSSRSVRPDAVLHQIRVLHEHGYREIVLTGIHIGRYGADLDPPLTLIALIESILACTHELRVRLSSVEPTEVTPRLVELLAQESRLAPHLHIPLQSGDDAILAAMNRPYRAQRYRETIEALARAREDLAIGTDLMVGFPGETEERFAHTLALVRDLPISYFHVFSFSPRPGTAAASMPDQVSPTVKKRRSKHLIELGTSKRRSFLRSQIGTEQLVLVEAPVQRVSPFARCLTGNYCDVFVPYCGVPAGALARVRITHLSHGNLYGMCIGEDAACEAPTGERGL
jgi:threonylcarbamoyladenosine tRNA methylthiotransferase MtaB